MSRSRNMSWSRNMRPQTLLDEAEQRLLPAPARGIMVAAALTAAAAALIAVTFGPGWLLPAHVAAHASAAAAPASSPVQLLWRVFLAGAGVRSGESGGGGEGKTL